MSLVVVNFLLVRGDWSTGWCGRSLAAAGGLPRLLSSTSEAVSRGVTEELTSVGSLDCSPPREGALDWRL